MEQKMIKVFVVDDDEGIRNDLTRRLKIRDAEAKTFSTAEDLIAHLITLPPDDYPTAVLTDYVLPGIGGEALIKKLLKEYPQLPIIIMSGMDIQGSIRAYGMGAYAVMPKPLDYNELMVTLRELLRMDDVAMQIARNVKNITEFDCCLLWELDKQDYPYYKITGWAGLDRDFLTITKMKEVEYPRLKHLRKGELLFFPEISKEDIYIGKVAAKERGWISLISVPILRRERLLGWIDCYKNEIHEFRTTQQKNHQLNSLQSYAELAREALQSRQLIQQSRVIHETNQSLVGILQESLIYDTILQKAIATTGADFSWIYKYSKKESKITLKASAGEGADKADKVRIASEGGITGKVAETGRSLDVKDITKPEEGYKPEIHIATDALLENSVLAVPLRRRKRTLGVLTVASRHTEYFEHADIQFLTNLAAITAVIMERNKLTQHLQGISQLAQEEDNFDNLADYVVNAVHDLTDADVNLWMLSKRENEGDDYLRIVRTSKPEVNNVYDPVPTSPGSSINAKALHEKRHIIIPDLKHYDQNPPFVNERALAIFEWRSFMVVPLLGKNGEHLGVISLLSKEVNKFAEDDGILVQHFANQAALVLQEQRHIRILQELANTGQQLTIGLSGAKTLLKRVTELATKIAKAELAVLYPYDPARENYYDDESIVHAGILRNPGKKFTQKQRKHGLGAFIREHEALIIEDIDDADPIEMYIGLRKKRPCLPGTEEYKRAEGLIREAKVIKKENIRAFIGVSLRAEEQIPGSNTPQLHEVAVLYFNFRAPRRFSKEELQVIDIFCHQVANVIHRNRLFYSLKKDRELIEGVHQSALHILEERDQYHRLQKIVEEAVKLLKAKGGKAYLTVNGSRQDLELVASMNLPKKMMKIGDILSEGQGMSREVLETKAPKIINNYKDYPRRIVKLENFFSAVAEVPLLFNGEVIGVLGVFDDHEERAFVPEDVSVLEKLAAQAALAIYNARLYDELDALNKTGLQIARQSGLKEIADLILKELKRVIDYDKATIQLIDSMDTPRRLLAYAGYKKPGKTSSLYKAVKDDKLIRGIVEQKKLRIINDTRKEPLWNPAHEATQDVLSWVCLPLEYAGKVLGLLMLDHRMPGYYTERDIPKLERFALQAAIGIYNASLEHSQLKALSDFAQTLANAGENESKENIFARAIAVLSEVLKGDKNKIGFSFYAKDESYLSNSLIQAALENLINTPLPFKTSLLTYNTVIPKWVEQEKEVKLLPEDNRSLLKGLGEKLLGPIWREGLVCGVLEVSSSKAFSDKNLKHFFSAMLALTSEAINRIHLKERRVEAWERRVNPYIVGAPIRTPQYFFGREAIVRQILDGIHLNNFLIEDERRIGKTSVLYHLKYQMEQRLDKDFAFYPVMVNLERTEEHEFWGHLRDSIYGIQGLARPKESGNYDFFEFRDDLDEVLYRLEERDPGKELRIVLLIDEVDKFKDYSSKTMLAKFRSLFQAEARIKTIMAGVGIKRRLEDDVTSPWYNQLILVKLSQMDEESARKLITDPIQSLYSYAPEAVEKILEQSERKPLAIQTICFHALNVMLNRQSGNKRSKAEDYEITLLDVIEAIKLNKLNN
ncbi:MAG: GAF domain-containing protein [Saprospiraceae bacterium]